MTTKKNDTTAARLETALARRAEAQTTVTAAWASYEAAYIPVLEADQALSEADHALAVALDAAEVENGDELALACDPARVRAALADALAAAEVARLEYEAAKQAVHEVVATARQAELDLAARRMAAGQPAPIALPNPTISVFAGPSRCATPGEILGFLDAQIANGPPGPSSNAREIARVRNEAITIRAAREKARIEREKREAEGQAKLAENQLRRDAAAARDRAQLAAMQARHAKEQADRAALADADRSRA